MTTRPWPLAILSALLACHSPASQPESVVTANAPRAAASSASIGVLDGASVARDAGADVGVAHEDSSSAPATFASLGPVAQAASTIFEDDLKMLQTPATWLSHTTFIGWTALNDALHMRLVCDPDLGGGRGEYCDFAVCRASVAQPHALPSSVRTSCVSLGLVAFNGAERIFDAPAGRQLLIDELAAEGVLQAGKSVAITRVKSTLSRIKLTLMRPAKPHERVRVAYEFMPDPERPQRLHSLRDLRVVTTPDERCTAAIGAFNMAAHYEGVATDTPMTFVEVFCD